jgi:hypothetical protein
MAALGESLYRINAGVGAESVGMADDEGGYDDGDREERGSDGGEYKDDAPVDGGGDGGGGDDGAGGGRGHWGYGAEGSDNIDDILTGGDGGDDEDDGGEVDMEHELPAFANQANRELNDVIVLTEKQLHHQQANAKDNRERVAVMREHLKNVKMELAHTQRLLEAKTKEVQTEDHLKQMAEREAGRIRQESRRLEREADMLQDQLNAVQTAIFKGSEKLEGFKVRRCACVAGVGDGVL